jgi:hypothetical protein
MQPFSSPVPSAPTTQGTTPTSHHVAAYTAKTESMEDLGYMVIRSGHEDDWSEIVNRYPYVFGNES